jgi:hypothetical protein
MAWESIFPAWWRCPVVGYAILKMEVCSKYVDLHV